MNDTSSRRGLAFRKMHGLGNDFVVVDTRAQPLALSPAQIRTLADRRTGIGFDQMLIIEPARNGGDAFMGVRNFDGGTVANCGNGARCVAALIMNETGSGKAVLETLAGPITAERTDDGRIAVDMGPARLEWRDIPLDEDRDTLHLDISAGPLKDGAAVGMGNPHLVFFVDDTEAIDLAALGPDLERHPWFPEHTNVEAVTVLDRNHLRMRVWERGVGITQACGTGACAVAVAAARRGLTDQSVTVSLDGGDLAITWRSDGHVVMTGPVAESFSGTLDLGTLDPAGQT